MIIDRESISYFAAIMAMIEKGEPIQRKPHDHADCIAALAHSQAFERGEAQCRCSPEWHGLQEGHCSCMIEDSIPLDFCPECDSQLIDHWGNSPYGEHLIMKLADGSSIIAQCCEGYQPIAI